MPTQPNTKVNSEKPKKLLVSCSRIKRIMQSSEEVGKLNSYCPLVVSKTVELFIKDLIETVQLKHENSSKNKIEIEDIIEIGKTAGRFDFIPHIEYGEAEDGDEKDVETESDE